MSGNFYTYVWLRRDRTPYYVGKTARISRAYGSGRHSVNSPSRDRIVVFGWSTEEAAFLNEKFLISLFGRKDTNSGTLYNHTDGGEGSIGLKQSIETIEKRASKNRGKKRSERIRRILSASKQGKKNPSYKARGDRHWNRGLVRSEETKIKIREKRAHQDMSKRIKSFCKRGHRRTPENLTKNRTCKTCKKLAARFL